MIGPVKVEVHPQVIVQEIVATMKKLQVDDGQIRSTLAKLGLHRSDTGRGYVCEKDTVGELFLIMDNFHEKLLARVRKGMGFLNDYPDLADSVLETGLNFLIVDSARRIIASQIRTEVYSGLIEDRARVEKTDWFVERHFQDVNQRLRTARKASDIPKDIANLVSIVPSGHPNMRWIAESIHHLYDVAYLSDTFMFNNANLLEIMARIIGTPDRLKNQWLLDMQQKKEEHLQKEQLALRREMKQRALKRRKMVTPDSETSKMKLARLLKRTDRAGLDKRTKKAKK